MNYDPNRPPYYGPNQQPAPTQTTGYPPNYASQQPYQQPPFPPQQPYRPPVQPPPKKNEWHKDNAGIIALLIFFFPVGLFLMWRYAKWSKAAKLAVTGLFVVLVIASSATNGKPTSTTVQSNQPTTQPTQLSTNDQVHTAIAQTIPTPTPKPAPKVFFDQSNQNGNLPIENSTAFSANGTLKIEYSCMHSYKDGVDVQLNVMPVDADGTLSFDGRQSWIVKLSCPDGGSDTFNANGLYKVTAATGGNVGWSLKITQA